MNLQTIPSDLLTCMPQGSWRITGTRVSIDSVIAEFWAGATPEEICQDFPVLSLVQVYSSIAYYLTHREQIDAYLQAQQQTAEQLNQALQARHRDVLTGLRERLLARREYQNTPA